MSRFVFLCQTSFNGLPGFVFKGNIWKEITQQILEPFLLYVQTLLHNKVSECYQSLTAHQHQKGHTVPKPGDNDCNVNSSGYSLSTALCESIRYQAKSEQNVQQDLTPRVRHGEAALPKEQNTRVNTNSDLLLVYR